jgi:hypothetical protein
LYEKYYQQLNDFDSKNKPILDQQEQIFKQLRNGFVKPSPSPMPAMRQNSNKNNNKAPVIVKRSYMDEFKKRREEFERNRMKGKGLINNNNFLPRPPRPDAYRRDEKSALEERLRQIRMQNLNNRKMFNREVENKQIINNKKSEVADSYEDNNRIKKIAALRVRFKFNSLLFMLHTFV